MPSYINLFWNVEILSKIEVTPDVAIITLHPEETSALPRSVLSVSANHCYCTATWNIIESKDVLLSQQYMFILCTLVKHQPTCLFDLSSASNSKCINNILNTS